MSTPPPTSTKPAASGAGAGAASGRGGWWALGQTILMIAVGASGWFLPGRWHGPWPGVMPWLAALLLLAGAWIGIAGVLALRGSRTIFPEPPPGAVLVEAGIYCHIRHPLYLAVILLAAAWACWRQSGWGLSCGGALAVFLIAKALEEERRLCRRFPGYADYRRRTARFVPGVW